MIHLKHAVEIVRCVFVDKIQHFIEDLATNILEEQIDLENMSIKNNIVKISKDSRMLML